MLYAGKNKYLMQCSISQEMYAHLEFAWEAKVLYVEHSRRSGHARMRGLLVCLTPLLMPGLYVVRSAQFCFQ